MLNITYYHNGYLWRMPYHLIPDSYEKAIRKAIIRRWILRFLDEFVAPIVFIPIAFVVAYFLIASLH